LNAPENALPSKQEVLAFQARWIRRAGWAALAACFIVAGSIVYQHAGLSFPSANSDADQLAFFHAHEGRLIGSSVIQGIGFMFFVGPLLFLFRSAAARSVRVRRAFTALIVLGPIAFGLGLVLSAIGTSQSARNFVRQEPAAVQRARQEAATGAGTAAPVKKGAPKGTTTAQATATAAQTNTIVVATTTRTVTATTPSGGTTTTTVPAGKPLTQDQAGSVARENLADHLNRHTTMLIIGGLVSTIGVLGMVFGMVYTSMWCMRLGLLTRFWGALGIAFGLFLVIPIFPPIPGLVLFFAAIGLMFLGVWPRPLPPAWAAGEAIPWQRPAEDLGPPSGGEPGTVEGSGRQVSEPPLDETEAEEAQPTIDQFGHTQGQRRKKRKKRS
jgi:hypothetical protein